MDDLQVKKYIMEESSGYVFTIHIEQQNMFKMKTLMSPLEDAKSTAFNEDVLIYVGEGYV